MPQDSDVQAIIILDQKLTAALQRDDLAEAQELIDEMERALDRVPFEPVVHAVAIRRATLLRQRGDFQRAREVAVPLAAAHVSALVRGAALVVVATIDMQERNITSETEDMLTEAISAAEESGDRGVKADALHNLGVIADMGGRDEEAERYWTEALAIYRDLGKVLQVADCLHMLGVSARQREDDARAVALLIESISRAREAGDSGAIARRAGDLARTHLCMAEDSSSPELRRQLLTDGLAAASEMLDAHEKHWAKAISEPHGIDVRSRHAEDYFNNLETYVRLQVMNENPAEAFAAVNRAKCRVLQEDLAHRRAERGGLPILHPEALVDVLRRTSASAGGGAIALIDFFVMTDDEVICFLVTTAGSVRAILSRWPGPSGDPTHARRMAGSGQGVQARGAFDQVRSELEKIAGRASAYCDQHSGIADDNQRFSLSEEALQLRSELDMLGRWWFPPEICKVLEQENISHVFLSPDPRFFAPPWAALNTSGGEALLDQAWTFSIVPSSSALQDLDYRCSQEHGRGVCVLAPDREVNETLGGEDEYRAIDEAAGLVTFLREQEATLSALNSARVDYSWIHIRGHGSDEVERGYVPELADGEWRLPLPGGGGVVVAVCCRTGSAMASGYDLLGLAALAEQSDLSAMVAPVVSIEGVAACYWMKAFYAELSNGAPIARAVAVASRATRLNLPHPAFWAHFVCIGDHRKVLPIGKNTT